MASQRVQTISFLLLVLVALIIVALILRPFVNIFALSIIVAILVYPIYSRLLGRLKSRNLAALLTTLIVLLIVLIPLAFFGQIIFNHAYRLYDQVRTGNLIIHKDQLLQSLPAGTQNLIESASRDINTGLNNLAGNAFRNLSTFISNVAGFFLSVFLLFFILFFLLRDGENIKQIFMDISPISASKENILIDKIIFAVNGVVKGSFLTALSQGIAATIGFFIFGVPEPVVWGAFTVLAALVPNIGTAIAMVPAVGYLVVTGNIPQAIGLAIWAATAVALIDNFLGPYFASTNANLHPLLVLLSVLGGLEFFGFLGFLLGPIIMAIFVALVDMYRKDFKDYLHNK